MRISDWSSDVCSSDLHESIDEMKHADRLAERILFLDGLPNFQMLGRLRIGETVEEILKADLELEREALPQLRGAIEYCETKRDYVTRDLLRSEERRWGNEWGRKCNTRLSAEREKK